MTISISVVFYRSEQFSWHHSHRSYESKLFNSKTTKKQKLSKIALQKHTRAKN